LTKPTFAAQAPNLRYFGPVIEGEITLTAIAAATMQAAGNPLPHPVRIAAMIDTGTSASVIRQGIAAQFCLDPVGMKFVDTPTASNVPCPEYRVRMQFAPDFALDVDVIEMPLRKQHIDCLIVRDVLARGVFIYLGSGNAFTLSI
jgi:hypothetical protein